eukprot:CAMPEP_0114366590 /NCGR_PEP_ID=MMETSP0101-20121206/29382_1 /TAXON_ID=38822 ORGANISM="Pteridomonas danica, Strain PT" /NCGR_SAMPLE_ID=MMETSP0101 /ASSEMBLY_ACC=CAM_ASM_000211 /LENGTH=64 /DNA_ID=CAMNT_0001515711 /DNA_START=18 /DNA_END=209 /DNA_ORIENTATION=+
MASVVGNSVQESDQEELSVEELRALAENLNFNLTSVLQNPRSGTGTRSFYDEFMDFDPFKMSFD